MYILTTLLRSIKHFFSTYRLKKSTWQNNFQRISFSFPFMKKTPSNWNQKKQNEKKILISWNVPPMQPECFRRKTLWMEIRYTHPRLLCWCTCIPVWFGAFSLPEKWLGYLCRNDRNTSALSEFGDPWGVILLFTISRFVQVHNFDGLSLSHLIFTHLKIIQSLQCFFILLEWIGFLLHQQYRY